MSKFKHYNKGIYLLPGYDEPTVDIYSVLEAFQVTSAPLQHAIKKQLLPGDRGVKNKLKDLREARASLDRAIEMECQRLGIAAKKGL